MIFKPELAQLILEVRKTQTRRPSKTGEAPLLPLFGMREVPSVVRGGRALWEVGQDYAVCPGRGKRQVARIKITRIRQEWVSMISDLDVHAEGFESNKEFFDAWAAFYGNKHPICWVLDFELVKTN